MSQAQKARWIKTAAIVFVLLACFYWISPKGVDLYNGGSYSAVPLLSFFFPA